jgi:peptidoglycan/LPS O-acetylase OafA/YrhL
MPLPPSSTSLQDASKSLAYRPDIDGLRAIAVLGVVFFHAGLGFPGGYVGVDVFFVISGFLITSLILKDLKKGSFSLLEFWERRARRILPALTVVVLAVLVAGWFLLLPEDYETLGKQVIALVAISSNIKFWRETGYFAEAAEEKPLLHTWSLSLEEQFYVVIPLLLIALYHLRKSSWVVPMLVGGAVLSFALSVYGSYRAPAATFFLLPMRAWELAAGSLLAFASPFSNPRIRTAAAWCGAAAVLLPFFFYTPGTRFPGLTAVPPVAGAALLIWSGLGTPTAGQLPLPNRLLTLRPLVWIGLLSYSLYLWHWPIFAFHKYSSFVPASIGLRLFFVFGSFALAWFSLRFVERPFRSQTLVQTRARVFYLTGGTLAALVITSFAIWQSDGVRNRLPVEAQNFADARHDFAFLNELNAADIPDGLVPLGTLGKVPKVLVWGDSHAMAILPAIDAVCKEEGYGAIAATASSTAPLLDWYKITKYGLNEGAPAFNAAVLDYIEKSSLHKLTHVILAARWEGYLDGSESDARFASALELTIRRIEEAGCRVILLKEVPGFPFDVPKAAALKALTDDSFRELKITLNQYHEDTSLQQRIFRSLKSKSLTLIAPEDFFANTEGIIHATDTTGLLYRDAHHLSTQGSMRLKPILSALFHD